MPAKPEIIAKRRTYDDWSVQFWSDGAVTFGLRSDYVRGAGIARSAYERRKNVDANWLLAGEVSVYDQAELPKAVATARRVVRRYGSHEALAAFRRAMGPARVEDRRRDPAKRAASTTIATATSLAAMQKHVDKYFYITGYRIHPTTLQITSPSNIVPTGVRITRQPGGYRLVRT